MQLSKTVINLIKEFEGFSPTPYLCSAGYPTIGYGSRYYETGKAVTLQDKKITEIQANKLLLNQLKKYEKAVNYAIKVELNQNEFDALISFSYNVGINAFYKSKLLSNINKGFKNNQKLIKTNYMSWIYIKGKKSQGLFNRRLKEYEIFIS